MGIYLSGIAVKGIVSPPADIVHFYRGGNTIIFLDLSVWDIIRFSVICEANLLDKADFSEKHFVYALSKILKDKSFVAFFNSEHADMTDREYAVIFKDGIYQERGENVYQMIISLGIPFDFMYDHSYWNYDNAKETYLKNI